MNIPDDVDPAEIADPGMLPANPDHLQNYLGWRYAIEHHGVDPLNEMLGLYEQTLWDMHFAGVLTLDGVHDRLADARALATAAEDVAREA